MASHLASLWKWDFLELGNGLLFYIGMSVVRTDGRSGGRAVGAPSRDYQIFSDG